MNIHMAQSVQAINELKRIANVKYQIIGAKDSNPIIGCVQDALSGSYLLTKLDTKILGSEVSNFLCNTSSETKNDIIKDKIYTGHEIFSHIIPKGINNTVIKNGKKVLEIIDGELKIGVLDKNTLSKVKNSIIHFIWDKYGPDKTRKFIDDAQRLALAYLNYHGFTFGISDCLIDNKINEQIKQLIMNKILEYNITLTQYENEIEQINPLIIENNLSSELNAFSSEIGNMLIKILGPNNNLFVCIDSKSKGSLMNIQHIMGCVGQKSLEGVRIRKKIENRTLPMFHKDNDTPEARGFIKSCYIDGIKTYEYFYDAMASREGLIHTYINTAKTGYIQRQLIKGLEDLIIKYDNTNRNSKNVIIQYVYAENGVDQTSQTELTIGLISLNNNDIENTYGFTDSEIKLLEKEHKIKNLDKLNKKYIEQIKTFRDNLRKIQTISTNNYKTLEEKYMLPVNLFRLTQFYSKNKVNLELSPQDILDGFEELLNSPETRLLPGLKDTDKNLLLDDRSLKYLFEISIHDYLCPKKCIFKYGLSKKDFKLLINEIKLNFVRSLVQPGEMIGIVTAQSIGEPTSQLTLNAKHSAGSAVKSSTTSGIPRIEELLHYSKDIKTPQMTIYFDKEISTDRSKVNKISSYLTHLTIKELITSAEIYYDMGNGNLKDDKVSNPFFVNNQKVELNTLPFVFRIKLNMEKMHDKETSLLDIKTKFITHWSKHFANIKNMKRNEKEIFTKINKCAILANNDIENQIVHIRFSMSSFNYNLLTEFLKIVLEQITLKGIDNITGSDLVQERKLNFNSETGDMDIGKEYVVYTEGINMEKLKYIKGINYNLNTCNDVATIFRLYGIEAARQILINEFMATFNAGGSRSVNHGHMSVLIDMMTHMGIIISIDRHGLDKIDSEPLAKASFEKMMDHFLNAALFNQKDNLQSVSSRVMLGKVIPGGTGSFELMLDTDKLENSEYTKDENGGRVTFISLEEETLFKDIIKYGFFKNDFYLPL